MRIKWFLPAAIGSAVLLVLLATQRPAVGQDNEEARNLPGTWNVTLRFSDCTALCPCPGGVPNIPIPALHTYLKRESVLEIPGGTLFRGPGLGTWEHVGDHDFTAHFRFFIFNPDGSRRGSEVVTSHIDLSSPDTFEAAATFDLFDAAGNMTGQGCRINETATRFE